MPPPDRLRRRSLMESAAARLRSCDTACPLDCPDSCSLAVTVQQGRVDRDRRRRTKNPVTDGYICAKVRELRRTASTVPIGCSIRRCAPDERARAVSSAYGGTTRSSWSPTGCGRRATAMAAQSILPYSYGGSNGLLTQDNLDAQLWRRFGTSRLARTVCAAPTGVANMALYGKMPSVTYQDYPHARADPAVGREPVRVRHPSHSVCSRGADSGRDSSS